MKKYVVLDSLMRKVCTCAKKTTALNKAAKYQKITGHNHYVIYCNPELFNY